MRDGDGTAAAAAEKGAATRLSRAFDRFLRSPMGNNSVGKKDDQESSDSDNDGDDSHGGGSTSDDDVGLVGKNDERGRGQKNRGAIREGVGSDGEEELDFEDGKVQRPNTHRSSGKLPASTATAAAADAATPLTCENDENEARVVAFVNLLKAAASGNQEGVKGEEEFLEQTR